MLACSFKAVNGGFRHLLIRMIIDPPHHLFDTALARQIAIHILHYQFEVTRPRLVAMQEHERTAVARSLRTINRRLEEPVLPKLIEDGRGVDGTVSRDCFKFDCCA